MIRILNRYGLFPGWLCWITVGVLGYLDYLTGHVASFSYFYLIPVCTAAWYGGRLLTLSLAGGAALTWQLANDLAGEPHHSFWLSLWNDLIQLLFFLTVALMLRRIRGLLAIERKLSRRDPLTDLLNRRAFGEVFSGELVRLKRTRSPMLLGYLDLDRFKQVNDRWGHAEGDKVLREVAETLRSTLRRSDVISRMGGDEFAFLLPDTGVEGAETVARKLLLSLDELSRLNGWPVGASLGMLEIGARCVPTVEAALKAADSLMYDAKLAGRGQFRTAHWRQPPVLPPASPEVAIV